MCTTTSFYQIAWTYAENYTKKVPITLIFPGTSLEIPHVHAHWPTTVEMRDLWEDVQPKSESAATYVDSWECQIQVLYLRESIYSTSGLLFIGSSINFCYWDMWNSSEKFMFHSLPKNEIDWLILFFVVLCSCKSTFFIDTCKKIVFPLL